MTTRKKLKEQKRQLARLAKESITIESFLSNYLGVRDNTVLSNQISHQDIKELLPLLTRPSFDHVVNEPDSVFNGEIILVEDSYGSVVPYYNPSYTYEETEFIGEFVEEKPKEEIPNVNVLDLSELSNYELQQLLHIYSKNNIRSAYRKVRRELTGRKDSHHASQESKARVLSKKRDKRDLD